ncbi:hypothetical protein BU14_2191s0001 [Porphyra umbilicalis]|uniref:Histidine--tRNA ligase, cytoplasmic n=1 Tax=Porphyra umbilicalis TaxID=2786 RepID=A0A1X6NJQ0_PORUM|nr:hypothetical protein BU14_2191s0001 [Porphyra umbilicalis]|eukprot:OSX68834.1 hypothetical protein BU14_2191s0001 [Porphyra umbilicalis]
MASGGPDGGAAAVPAPVVAAAVPDASAGAAPVVVAAAAAPPAPPAEAAQAAAKEGNGGGASGGGGGGSAKATMVKVVKGARDVHPASMAIRRDVFAAVEGVFRRHGAVAIDTPVFELRETLLNKYGEDSKLIYDLADQGGEVLSLRYDLTVPFARYMATYKLTNLKRYHIGKVYRRDQPAMARGRYREFHQCDFDIAGAYAPMVADAEVVTVLVELLAALAAPSAAHAAVFGRFTIKLNHRGLLDAIFTVCGVPADLLRPVCSAVDKLDKLPWAKVRAEMVDVKGLDAAVADRVGTYVTRPAATLPALVATLRADDALCAAGAAAALDDLDTLAGYLSAMGAAGPVRLDLSLARGLDYYTGLIYEAVLTSPKGSSLGSVAAGGRYDTLVGSFSSTPVPCVGCSLGIERALALFEKASLGVGGVRENATQVVVATVGKGLLTERMKVAAELWAGGIAAEFGYAETVKVNKAVAGADRAGVPLVVIVGEEEVGRGVVQMKVLKERRQEEVPRGGMVAAVREALAGLRVNGAATEGGSPAGGAAKA